MALPSCYFLCWLDKTEAEAVKTPNHERLHTGCRACRVSHSAAAHCIIHWLACGDEASDLNVHSSQGRSGSQWTGSAGKTPACDAGSLLLRMPTGRGGVAERTPVLSKKDHCWSASNLVRKWGVLLLLLFGFFGHRFKKMEFQIL